MIGLILGRFQPFHIAHEAMIQEILADGLKPLVFLGSANIQDDRNPYSPSQRRDMLQLVFPGIDVALLEDRDDWNVWYEQISRMRLDKSQIVWYINNKESDRTIFEFDGKLYTDQFYTQIFKDLGYQVKEVTFPKLLNLDISASKIRNDLEGNRHYLDARVYHYIKRLQNDPKNVSYYR